MMNMVTPTSTGGPESRYNHESVSVIPTGDNSRAASFSARLLFLRQCLDREKGRLSQFRVASGCLPTRRMSRFFPCTREVVAHQDLSII